MKDKDSRQVWKCKECGKEFRYKSEKRRHEQSHAPGFQCKVCAKKFSFLSGLRRHEKQHERKGSVFCDDCGGKFRDETLLQRHMQYAHKGSFTCLKCNKTFSSQLALHRHSKIHKPESEREFRCSHEGCSKTFNFHHHLKHHEKTHTDAKQYFCKECDKGFIQLYHLKIHEKLHEPDSWLPCTIVNCTKKFTNKYALKRHLATHRIKTDHQDNKTNTKEGSCVTEMVLCKTCNEFFIKDLFKKHTEKCIIHNSQDEKCENLLTAEKKPPNDIKLVEIEDQIKKIAVIDNVDDAIEDIMDCTNVVEPTTSVIESESMRNTLSPTEYCDNVISPVGDCTAALGYCLVTGNAETSDNCLCAQLTTSDNNQADLYQSVASKSDIKLPNDDLWCIDKRKKDKNACQGCECASICGINNNFDEEVNKAPEFEKRDDNIVKIKESFDVDILDLRNKKDGQSVDDKIRFEDFGSPINTCKDVLGKCIVSGNSTPGEGCLCARMTADNQQMITQEIEAITPCPKSTWLSECM